MSTLIPGITLQPIERWLAREGSFLSVGRLRLPVPVWAAWVGALILFPWQPAVADDVETPRAKQAIEAYRKALDEPDRPARLQQFSQAAQLFRQVANAQHAAGQRPHASLFTNAGNAALQADDLGNAILGYRRALVIDPAHPMATRNLRLARQQLPAHLRPSQDDSIWRALFFWNDVLAGHAAVWAASCFCIAAVLWAMALRFDRAWLRSVAIFPALLWVALLVSAVVSRSGDVQQAAIIIQPEVVARTADSQNAAAQFSSPLPAGVELTVTETRLDWVRAVLPSGDTTWLPRSSISLVSML